MKLMSKEQIEKRLEELQKLAEAKTVALEKTQDGTFTAKP
jgi:pyruvate/2-oxoglutarate dehydrogenase complex dihydrolipoamide acyltransferase (E2) component